MRDEIMASAETRHRHANRSADQHRTVAKTFPEVSRVLSALVFMGGSVTRGNKGIMAEFNIFVDPEAAKICAHFWSDITGHTGRRLGNCDSAGENRSA